MTTEKVNSVVNPHSQFHDIFIDNFLSNENTLYLVIGTDSGEIPQKLLNIEIPDGTRYLFIEPDNIYKNISQRHSLVAHEKISITPLSEWFEAATKLDIAHYLYANNVKLIRSVTSINENETEYNAAQTEISDSVEKYHKELKESTLQLDFHRTTLLNTVDNILEASFLQGKGKGTALVVGAGPSLDKFSEWIKENQSRLTIIAASRLYPLLKSMGIRPTILVSVDPFPYNYEQSKALLEDTSIPLFHSNHVSPKLISQHTGNRYYMGYRFPWKTDNNKENIISAPPTVVHSAIHLAISSGFEQIILAGVDLCNSPTGKTHANAEVNEGYLRNTHSVETYSGKRAEAFFSFTLGIKKLEEQAKLYSGKIYNLNVDAAKVDGISFNASPKLPENKQPIVFNQKISRDQIHQHLLMVQKEFKKAEKKYLQIQEQSQKALQLNLDPRKNLDLI